MTFDAVMRCWPVDLNRPLSQEEEEILSRLGLLTVDQWAEIYGWRE